jgi:hypothetical protein
MMQPKDRIKRSVINHAHMSVTSNETVNLKKTTVNPSRVSSEWLPSVG